jgi:hypothetical protein
MGGEVAAAYDMIDDEAESSFCSPESFPIDCMLSCYMTVDMCLFSLR